MFKLFFFSYSWVFKQFFWEIVSSLPVLFVHIRKNLSENLRSSRSQMFFKISVLKNFSMLAKNTCVRVSFNKAGSLKVCNLLKKRFQHRCFPVNIPKFLRTAFLWNTFCSLYFYVMIEFFGRLWVQNWRVSYFLYYCFVFLHNSSVRIGSP